MFAASVRSSVHSAAVEPDHLLAGAREKLSRANEHIHALQREWGEAVEARRDQLFAPIQLNPDTGLYVVRVGDFQPPYLRFAILGGEIAYQLKSALEHTVQALVKANGSEPHLSTGFAIRVWPPHKQSFFAIASASSLRGVTKAAIALIGDEQPYEAGNESAANAHYLAILKTLADADKHRALFVAATVPPDLTQFEEALKFPGADRVDIQLSLKPGQRLQPGAEIARVHLETAVPDQRAYVDGPITLAIQFHDAEGGDAQDDLRSVSDKVSALIDSLEPFILYPP
jgi:hypothetical protein